MSNKNTGRKAKNLKIKERQVRRQAQALVREAEQVVEAPAVDDRATKLAFMEGLMVASQIVQEARTIGAARKAIDAAVTESRAFVIKEAVGA